MKVPPLATAVLAGLALMWATFLVLQEVMVFLPPLSWAVSSAILTVAMTPVFVVVAKVYRGVPQIVHIINNMVAVA